MSKRAASSANCRVRKRRRRKLMTRMLEAFAVAIFAVVCLATCSVVYGVIVGSVSSVEE